VSDIKTGVINQYNTPIWTKYKGCAEITQIFTVNIPKHSKFGVNLKIEKGI
jgi:hypothetical protein